MIELKPGNISGITRLVDRQCVDTAKIWVCKACGVKVYHCYKISEPKYQCLCGGKGWRKLHD